ncbi:MAG: ComEC/Rec2 family competence protein, partial [Clostridia bacterium]|nr:ComEC/Rec2 family competence protein [Clostridia bacterium]
MRRPLAVIGFSFVASLIAASFMGFYVNAALAVLFAVSAGVAFFSFGRMRAGKPSALALLAAALALAAYCTTWQLWYLPAARLATQTAVLSGTVTDLPQVSNGKYYYIVDAKSITIGGKDTGVRTKIRIGFASALATLPYDTVSVQVRLSLPYSGAGFDSASYYRSKGVYLFAKPLTTAQISKNTHPPLMFYAIALRQTILKRIYGAVSGQPGALAAGILIGDTTQLSSQIKSDFTDTGISHTLAVSGTQISLIAQCLLLLLCALRVPRRAAAPAAMA